MPTTPVQPILTVNQPAQNAVVGLNQPFQISGLVTDRGMPEPIMIDSVTVQIDGGPLIHANLTHIPNQTLTEVSFRASAQISSGSDPHIVTIVATNDQGLRSQKTVTVFAGPSFEVDVPALLIDVRSLIPITADDPQVLALIRRIQGQLGSLSEFLASTGKVLIGPNLIVQPVTSVESLVRIGLWIEDPGFPVVPPSDGFSLPRLSDVAATACFAATPVLTIPNPGSLPSFAVSIPVETLQRLVDAMTPALKSQASKEGFDIDKITARTSSPATVDTIVTGHVLDGTVPATFTISETVGVAPVRGGQSAQMAPTVLATNSSSSVGSILDWIVASFIPFIGLTLAYAFYKVSVSASGKSGLASSFLGSIPARIPFGNRAISLSPDSKLPDFPSLDFFWNSFAATSAGLVGAGITDIAARTQSDVSIILHGPDSFQGYQDTIVEFTDPTMGYILENITPDPDKFSWKISGAGSATNTLESPSPAVQAGDFFPHFPLPLKVPAGDYQFNLAVNAVETCQSDATKTLTGAASKAILFRVRKRPQSASA